MMALISSLFESCFYCFSIFDSAVFLARVGTIMSISATFLARISSMVP